MLVRFPAIDGLLSMCVQLSDFPAPRSDSLCVVTTLESKTSDARVINAPDELDSIISLTPSSGVSCDDFYDAENGRKRCPRGFTTTNSVENRPGLSNIIVRSSVSTSSKLVTANVKPMTVTMSNASIDKSGHSSRSLEPTLRASVMEKDAEIRITKLISLKYMLDMVRPLHDTLRGSSSTLLKTYKEVICYNLLSFYCDCFF